MRFPEIEDDLLSAEYYQRLQALEASSTSIDVLEIPQALGAATEWHPDLDHNALLGRLDVWTHLDIRPLVLF